MKNIISLLSIILLAGCASVGRNFDSRNVGSIQKGITTEADLVKMFGPPANRSINSESGSSMMWIYSQATTKGATFIPVIGAFAGGVDTKTKTLLVNLDQSGKVATYTYSGGGLGTEGMTQSDPENQTTNKPTAFRGGRR